MLQKMSVDSNASIPPILEAKPGLKLHLEPSISIDEANISKSVVASDVLEGIFEATPKEAISLSSEALEAMNSEEMRHERNHQDLRSPEAEIIWLGTGSSIPSKHRNVSGTLLRVPGCGSYLLDCGENSLGQLKRIFSPQELSDVLQDLRVIWISHMHADHHLGTASVIRAWYEVVYPKGSQEKTESIADIDISRKLTAERKLFIISNKYMANWLGEYSKVEDLGYEHIVPLKTIGKKYYSSIPALWWDTTDVGFYQKHS